MRLLNVACTRAKGKLVIVAHHDHLIQKAPEAASLSAFLRYMENHGRIIDARTDLANYADLDVSLSQTVVIPQDQWLGHPKEIGFFTDGTFYPTFLEDLRRASKEVIIFSPFIAAKRLADLITTLRHLNDRGVPTAVVTRDRRYSDSVARELIQQVSQAGIRVVQREALHEKLAFIDKQIAWLGSLNILSHSRSSEVMIRFAQPDFVERLLELTGTSYLLQQEEKKETRNHLRSLLATAIEQQMTCPPCPKCGETTELRFGKYGPFFGCISYRSRGCDGLMSVPRRVLELVVRDLALSCPECGSPITNRSGRRGLFLGCTRYPDCRWTNSI